MKILINDIMQFSDLPDDLKSPGLADRYLNTGTLNVSFTIPDDYSIFEEYDGILSQPYFDTIDGVLSQPMSQPPINGILYDDVGNILTDDNAVELYNNDFILTTEDIIEGTLSQPFSSIGSNEFDCLGIGGTDATEIIINDDIIISSGNDKSFGDGLYDIGQIVTASTITIEHNGSYMGRLAAGTCRSICISPSREPGFYSSVKPRRSLSGQVIPTAGGYGGQLIGVDFRYKIGRDIIEDFRRAYITQTMQGYPFFLDFDNDDWLPINKFYGETSNSIIFQSSINGFKYSKRFEFKQAF